MKTRPTVLAGALASALVLAAAPVASAMPTAVEHGVVIQGGLTFQKTIVLNQAALCDGSVRLEKGSYDVRFESLGGNKVRASFFQGGTKRGEAHGIIVVADSGKGQTGPGGGPHAAGVPGASRTAFGDVAFGPEYGFKTTSGKHELAVGGPGLNQILIGLSLPGATKLAPPPPGIVSPTDLQGQKIQPDAGAQKVQPAK